MKVMLICPHCGSSDIACDAAAIWSVEDQDWVLAGTHDCVTCDDCGRDEIEPRRVEIAP